MMQVLHYHKNPKLQLSGLKQQKKCYAQALIPHGVGRVVGALGCETGFAGSLLD